MMNIKQRGFCQSLAAGTAWAKVTHPVHLFGQEIHGDNLGSRIAKPTPQKLAGCGIQTIARSEKVTPKTTNAVSLIVLAGLLTTAQAFAFEPVYKQEPTPEVNPWAVKGIASKRAFGACYTRKTPERDGEWNRFSRTDEYADVAVRFGDNDEQIVFGRETSYLPVWHGGERPSQFREVVVRHGDGPWKRPDRINRHARARIIEFEPERIVIHWRYIPMMTLPLPGKLPDQTKFVDEYFLIRPDHTVIRAVLEGKPSYKAWREAAPGTVMRCKLGKRGVENLPAHDGDAKLMVDVMNLQPVRQAKPAEIHKMPADLPKPLVELTFDDASGGTVSDTASGRKFTVQGHSALWQTGVSGTALEFDGWTTKLQADCDLGKRIKGSITLDFYLTIVAYPWMECSLIEQLERDDEGHPVRGMLAQMDRDGKLTVTFKIGTGGSWLRLQTEQIPRHQWTRITAVVDSNGQNTSVLYVNGKEVARGGSSQVQLPDGAPLVLGGGGSYNPSRPRHFNESYRFTFDGLLDELRIYDRALSAEQVNKSTLALGQKPGDGLPTDITRHGFPTNFADTRTFGAHYCHMNFHPSWDRMFRMCGQPDIVVTFDKSPARYVLWHGVGYIPMLVNENGFWYSNEFNETWGYGGCYEPMSDKRVVYGRVHIIEQSPARVVLKWRYPLCDVHYEIHGERTDWPDSNWGKWATWYLTIYPDGSMVKRMRVYSGKSPRLEWHESMGIMAPNQKPEDILDTRPALTLVTGGGEIRKYDWIDVPPTNVNYEKTFVHVINMVGDYDPFSIQRILGGDVYKSNNKGTGYSPFPSWNHWPVAQLPSDRFDTSHNHRAAHSSITHIRWDDYTPYGEKGLFVEKLLMEGMSNKPADQILPLAKSWLAPAKATPGAGVTAVYDAVQRAYVLTRESGKVKTLQVTLAGSKDSPLVNPVLVVQNWSADQPGKVTVSPAAPAEVRQGVVRRPNGVNALVVWMELTTENPVEVKIDLP